MTQGYALFEANCARCHGAQGQGGIGPTLDNQAKLLTHLTPGYLMSVLTVGGRYVCGDPNSLMPIWSDQGNPPGPLNYRNLQELIAFITAPSTLQFQGVDPTTGQTVTMSGWRDPSYVLPAGATPVPSVLEGHVHLDLFPRGQRGAERRSRERGAQQTRQGARRPPAARLARRSRRAARGDEVLQLAAANIAYDQTDLAAPAGVPFQIAFTNDNTDAPQRLDPPGLADRHGGLQGRDLHGRGRPDLRRAGAPHRDVQLRLLGPPQHDGRAHGRSQRGRGREQEGAGAAPQGGRK